VFLIEGITRLFFKITDKDIDVYRNFSFERLPKIFVPDPVVGCKLIPNVSGNAFTSDFQVIYKINSMGLRDKEITDTNKFKIVFLGDSLTFGEGIPYGARFSDRIEKDIDGVYTINAGIPGYGIDQMLAWFRNYGVHLYPDLIICSITPSTIKRLMYHEIESAPHLIMCKKNKDRHHEGRVTRRFRYYKNIFAELLRKSYFYSFVKVRAQIMQKVSYLKERDEQVWKKIVAESDNDHKITSDGQRKVIRSKARGIF